MFNCYSDRLLGDYGVVSPDYSDIGIKLGVKKIYKETLVASYGYGIDLRNFKDQTIVLKDGSFSADKRKDIVHTFNIGVEYQLPRIGLGLENGTKFFSSNQNSFDAGAAKFIDGFYSYFLTEFTPSLSLYLGKKEKLSMFKFWWSIGWRRYGKRLAQDADGNYLSDKTTQMDNVFGISFSYPVVSKLNVLAKLNRHTAISNMKYEASYRYNYTVTNYFAGVNWQY